MTRLNQNNQAAEATHNFSQESLSLDTFIDLFK